MDSTLSRLLRVQIQGARNCFHPERAGSCGSICVADGRPLQASRAGPEVSFAGGAAAPAVLETDGKLRVLPREDAPLDVLEGMLR